MTVNWEFRRQRWAAYNKRQAALAQYFRDYEAAMRDPEQLMHDPDEMKKRSVELKITGAEWSMFHKTRVERGLEKF